MLLAALPHAFVAPAIGIGVDTVAFLFVVDVLAFVASAVGPLVMALAVHVVFFPVALVHSAVLPRINAVASDLIFDPVAFELALVSPLVHAIPILHAILVLALVLGPVNPRLLALPLLHVVDPLALVPTPVDVGVHAEPAGLIRSKLSNVDVALRMPERSLARGLVLEPVALVHGAVHPLLDAIATALLSALSFVNKHLPLVHAAIRKLIIVNENQAVDVGPELRQQVLVGLLKCILLIDFGTHSRLLLVVGVHARLVLLIELRWVLSAVIIAF